VNDEVFEQIHKSLTVEQIMTPKKEFYFHPQDSKFHKEISIFPIANEDGSIIKYFDSNGSREYYILPNKTVSKDLDIMSLIKMLDRNSFFFVIHDEIVGIVTLADLRKGAVRMFFYLLLYRLENQMKMFFKERVSEAKFIELAKSKCRIKKKMIRLQVPLIFDIIYQDSHSADILVPSSNPAHNPSPPSFATSPPGGTGRIVIERGR
jgi:hypothetical protein